LSAQLGQSTSILYTFFISIPHIQLNDCLIVKLIIPHPPPDVKGKGEKVEKSNSQKPPQKSFDQTFSKVCREPPAKRRSLSAESETPKTAFLFC
jgi:hypothetical protein